MRLIVVSGQSGAGKALRWEFWKIWVITALITCLWCYWIHLSNRYKAVSKTLPSASTFRNLPKEPTLVEDILQQLKQNNDVSVLFLDASKETLLKRYSETRRIHPLSLQWQKANIRTSHRAWKTLVGASERTSRFTVRQHRTITSRFKWNGQNAYRRPRSRDLVMVFWIFGFKYGLPSDADYVFDVRFYRILIGSQSFAH